MAGDSKVKDFSQWGEQKLILDYFGDFRGRFLDIGAFDGVTGSNTRALAELGWVGAYVEPNPKSFCDLMGNLIPGSVAVCSVVVPHNSKGFLNDIWGMSGDGQGCRATLAEFSFCVSSCTPKNLFEKFGNADFISVDAEGMDAAILESALNFYTPKLVCFEDDIPGQRNPKNKQDILNMLARFGYTVMVGTTSTVENSANTLVARS